MTTRTQNQDVEALKAELASLRTDVAALVEAMKQNQADATPSPEAPTDSETASEWEEMKAKIDEARRQGEEISRELSKEVQRHPLASVAIAFGIGYLASKIIK